MPTHLTAKVLSLEDRGVQSLKMVWEQPGGPGFHGGSGHSQDGLSLGSPPRCSEYHLVPEMWSQHSTGWDAEGRVLELLLCQNHDLCAHTRSRGSLPRGDGLPRMCRERFPFLTSSSLQQHHSSGCSGYSHGQLTRHHELLSLQFCGCPQPSGMVGSMAGAAALLLWQHPPYHHVSMGGEDKQCCRNFPQPPLCRWRGDSRLNTAISQLFWLFLRAALKEMPPILSCQLMTSEALLSE